MKEKKVYVFTDFDGTITQVDLGDDLFIKFGEFEPFHSQLLAGELHISKYWQILCDRLTPNLKPIDIYNYAMNADTDAYFKSFADYCYEEGFPIAVVSDGFDAYIEPVLESLNLKYLPIYCNKLLYDESSQKFSPFFPRASESCNCLVASCKRNSMLMNTDPEAVVVYIGDGYSDFCAAEHADIVFAKKHLAAYCFKNKIPHHSFHSFFDVKQIMKKLIKDNRLKVRHQAFLKRKAAFEAE